MTSGPPLIVFAGFSPSEVAELSAMLKRAQLWKKFFYLFRPFGKAQARYTASYVEDVLYETLKKVMSYELKKPEDVYGYPGNLLLVYATGSDDHLLYSASYKIFRLVTIARDTAGNLNLGQVIFSLQNRDFVSICHIGRSDCRLLPFRNFYIERSKTIDEKYLNEKGFRVEKGTVSLSKMGEGRVPKRAFKDERDFLYEISKDNHSDMDTYGEKELNPILRCLESKFRFGCPIPEKHHYHVTKDNRRLKGLKFVCTRSEDGFFTCSKTHDYLNLGPNDSVRE